MASHRLWAFALAAVVLAACGDGDAPPAPEPPTSDPSAPSPSGPAEPAGPTDPLQPTDPPAPTDPMQPTEPPEPTAPMQPTEPTEPTLGDPPPSDPTPPVPPPDPTACAGVVPEAPGPGIGFTQHGTGGGIATCLEPVTDGHGEWIGVGAGLKWYSYAFVAAASPGQPTGLMQEPRVGGGFPFAPQPEGYHAIGAGDSPGSLQRFDARGALLADDPSVAAWEIQGVPGGGSVLVAVENYPGPAPLAYEIVWLGPGGDRRAEAPLPAMGWIAVSSAGHVLAFAAGQARWYDRDGAPITGWFTYGAEPGALSLANAVRGAVALADGSVVIGLGTDRPLRFEPGTAAAALPPEWVTSRAGAAIAAVRGNRANAFATVKSARAASCEVELELLTPAGESCGSARLGAPEPCERVSFGADRTVFTTAQPGDACLWRWWTGLLR